MTNASSTQASSSLKAELLTLFDQTGEAVRAFASSRTPEERAAQSTPDDWSAKVLLAEIGFWMDYTVERMGYYARGEQAPQRVDFGALSERTKETWEASSWDDCLAYAEAQRARLSEAVRSSSDELLTINNTYEGIDGGPFDGEIRANGFIWPMQELEKYYKRVGETANAQAICAQLTPVVGEEEPEIVCDLISPAELVALAEPPLIIDVRGKGEYAAGHVAGAVNIPLGELRKRIGTLPTDRRIITYCNMHHPGHSRGERAAAMLAEHELQASAIAGGYPAWQKAQSSAE